MLVNEEVEADELAVKDVILDASSREVSEGHASDASSEHSVHSASEAEEEDYTEAFKSLSLKGASVSSTPLKKPSSDESDCSYADIPKMEGNDVESAESQDESESEKKPAESIKEVKAATVVESQKSSVDQGRATSSVKEEEMKGGCCKQGDKPCCEKPKTEKPPCCQGGSCSKKPSPAAPTPVTPAAQPNAAQDKARCVVM